MRWTLPSTGMWRGEVFAISDCLVYLFVIQYFFFLLSIIETHLYFTTEISGPEISQSALYMLCALFYKQVLYTTSVVILNICITYNDFCFVSFLLFTADIDFLMVYVLYALYLYISKTVLQSLYVFCQLIFVWRFEPILYIYKTVGILSKANTRRYRCNGFCVKSCFRVHPSK